MCILFLFLNDDPQRCPFRFIVANNRDEYWDRPTGTAAFRGDEPQWLGGGLSNSVFFFLFVFKTVAHKLFLFEYGM